MVNNSKILVAGGTGFIGSNLISELITKGNKVISLSRKKKNKNHEKEVDYIYHDLKNPLGSHRHFKFGEAYAIDKE